MAKVQSRTEVVAGELTSRGYRVFPTRHAFPQLLAVKDGKVTLVTVTKSNPNMDDPARAAVVAKLTTMGVDVIVAGKPSANPGHNGTRTVTSVSVPPDNQQFFHKLKQDLEVHGKSLSEWFNEMMVKYVAEEMGV